MEILKALGKFNSAMSKINAELGKSELPAYYVGVGKFNPRYKTDVRLVIFPPKVYVLIDDLVSGESFKVKV